MQENIAIELRNVTKKIGKKTIIEQLSFAVPRGEVFGFLGPNGAGKTTTIRMIVGLMSITSGEIIINGENVEKSFEKAIQHVGAIVENPEMYKYLTGYQNLIHFGRMHKGITKERIDEVVKLVGLENRIHEKVKRYSLGMRQRLGVAQAILHKPSVLILDEPTNGLDPAGIRELRDYLRELSRKENLAIVVSSHLLSEMELMCDRVAVIQAGKLVDVQLMQEFTRDDSAELEVLIEVDEPAQAKGIVVAALQQKLGNVAIENQAIKCLLTKEDIPLLNKALVEGGIRVYQIKTTSKTLEEKFLEMTRSEQIV